MVRAFRQSRIETGVNFLIATGYTGQTTEQIGSNQLSQRVGVQIPSYASLSVTYKFGQHP